MLKKILIAYDGSDPAQRAFSFALETAKRFAANLTVLAVAQPPEPATMVESTAMIDWATEHYERQFEPLCARAAAEGVPLETKISVGHPAEQIVQVAAEQETDLIVMGHRGKTRIREWLLGSVSKRVLSYAPCSVMIVR